jgi:hypothetical protein
VGSLSTDWWTYKDTHRVVPDACSVLWIVCWSILKQNCYRRWDLGLPPQTARLTQWPGHTLILQSKKVQDSAVSMKSDGYYSLRCLQCSVGWFHTSWFNNIRSYLSGNSKETQGVYLAKKTRMFTNGSSCAWQCLTSHCCSNCESLDLLGLENSSTSTTQSWCSPSDFRLFPKMEKHLRCQHLHSNEEVQNEVKKWLCAKDTFFFLRGTWKIDIYHCDKCLNRLGDYVEN